MEGRRCARAVALAAHRDETIDNLRGWYQDGSSYGLLTQRQHAMQAAHQAKLAGAPEAIIVGALLHDIGWKLSREQPGAESHGEDLQNAISMKPPDKLCVASQLGILSHCGLPDGADDSRIRAQHDVIGGCWLRMHGFDETCAHITEGHVLAKRYLCYAEPDYHAKLSPLSQVISLRLYQPSLSPPRPTPPHLTTPSSGRRRSPSKAAR